MAQTRMPDGDYKKMLLRFPQELLDVLQEEARHQQRSLNGQIVYALLEWSGVKQDAPAPDRPRRIRTPQGA